MQIFKKNLIEIEAKENTSPTITIPLIPPSVTSSCGCTEVVFDYPDYITINIDNLSLVKHMTDHGATFYIKTVSFQVGDEKVTIKITVTQ